MNTATAAEKWYVTRSSLRWDNITRKWTQVESYVAVDVTRYAADLYISVDRNRHELSCAPQKLDRVYTLGVVSLRTW